MKFKTKKLVLTSLFLALGLILPYFFHTLGLAGPVFLPMHIPVLIGAMLLGPRYGVILGLFVPLLSSMLTGMPILYPVAISMAFELATYGLVSGYLYKTKRVNVYISLIIAMILGRVVSGVSMYYLLSFVEKPFILKMFLVGVFIKAVWGITIQLLFIPVLVKYLKKIM